jgi:hypothetical protein
MSVPDGVQERVMHTKFDIYCFYLNTNLLEVYVIW